MKKINTKLHKLRRVLFLILALFFITGCTSHTQNLKPITGEAECSRLPSEIVPSFPSSSSQAITSSQKTEPSLEKSAIASEISSYSSEKSSITAISDNGGIDTVQYGILYDIARGEVLWAKNADSKVYPASLTKLLTAYTALQYVPKTTIFTVGSEQKLVNPQSSLCLIQEGHRLTLYDLICGMLMASGNDAAYTIAVNTAKYVYGKTITDTKAVKLFCGLMNQTAEKIGMRYSNFCNPDGWDNANHYTTVNDLLQLSLCAYKNNDIRTIAGQAEKSVVFSSGQNVTWENTNLLLHSSSKYYFPYATGLKTGTTDNAGNCLIATAKKNGKEFIVIGMDCDTDAQRYDFAIHMLNKAFIQK